MKLRYFSDLHLEFIKPTQIQNFIKRISVGRDEICVLAGDIGNPYNQTNYDTFMKFISKNFKKSFIIAGNHEYYNKTKNIYDTNVYLKKYFEQFDNISFLNNEFEHYNDHFFIGTTLWSQITNPTYEINDVYEIPNFDYIEYNKLNIQSVNFLKTILNEINKNSIIITHHMPSSCLIHNKYKTQKMLPYNQWFYCNMDELIEKNKDKIKCWIYGHTHTPSNILINKIPFVCNPIGYPNQNKNINFQTTITIDV